MGETDGKKRKKKKNLHFGPTEFAIGDMVCHKKYGFHGVIFDIDPEFSNNEEWYNAIPKPLRPRRDQPFYHLYALTKEDNEPYIAYVSEQNLQKMIDPPAEFDHPAIKENFTTLADGSFKPLEGFQ